MSFMANAPIIQTRGVERKNAHTPEYLRMAQAERDNDGRAVSEF